ncbi:MAG: DUF805 domain-containing protein [Oricola sp.]|nr:MAG: DUF805 domain-containing protein [Oricola sp.]
MSGAPDHPLTVKWVLFGFRGRIGRKSFWLGALGMILIQAAIVAQIAAAPEDSPTLALWGLVMLAVWIASAWAALALAVKRLHDIGLPGALAVLLLIPAVAFFTFVVLAVWPSAQEANEHGPPPFPRPN